MIAGPGLPRPEISVAEAVSLARERFGVTGEFTELGSQQDRNYRIRSDAGTYLLKVANPAFSVLELQAQDAGLQHLSAAGVDVPQPVPGLDGRYQQPSSFGVVRLLTFLPGTPLTESGYLAPSVAAALGRLAGRVSAGLADFDHPGLQRTLQWDLQHADSVVTELAHYSRHQERVLAETELASARLKPLTLRRQPVHGDITDDNVVARRDPAGRLEPVAAIDFGDLTTSWLVAELAVTVSCILHHNPGEIGSVLAAIAAFDREVSLTDDEIAAIWPLVVLRAAVLEVSGEQQIALDPTNQYAADGRDREWMIFEQATGYPTPVMQALIRESLGRHSYWGFNGGLPMIPGLVELGLPDLDLSVTSPHLHEGRWQQPDIEDIFGPGIARYGEYRLTRAAPDRAEPSATCALGTELVLDRLVEVRAPEPALVVTATEDSILLRCKQFDLSVGGLDTELTAGDQVAAGDLIGTGSRLWVQLCLDPELTPPRLCTPDLASGWLALCPDPAIVLGTDFAAPSPTAQELLAVRNAHFADVQEHYYANPPEIERGWRHHLVDTQGRVYLDMMNNVTALGHGHPALIRAISEQWNLLNTNSRFHYRALAELSSRLAELAPAGLDQVLLVNSGTEAVDLALRIARAASGRADVMAVTEAYHGWSIGADAVSSSVADNPNALTTRPTWVHLAAAPNSYRGRHRGPASGPAYVAEIRSQLETLDASGVPVGAFIAEAFYGNAGGVPLPDGYLKSVYPLIRERGGVCIADEVQVGFGRLGRYFWGFEQQGVVPDIITVAKSMGNGHPLGAVITTREIAEKFRSEGSLFSSAGGSPVSCRVALAVLDVMAAEGLQHNALVVGDHLRAGLVALMDKHPLIGAVHGMGLYLGVELVVDRQTLEPARAQAYAICERLRERGVIVQPTADRQNVLKIKPPLCLTTASADFFVAQLDEVLSRGW